MLQLHFSTGLLVMVVNFATRGDNTMDLVLADDE